jgi:hypothetical protein
MDLPMSQAGTGIARDARMKKAQGGDLFDSHKGMRILTIARDQKRQTDLLCKPRDSKWQALHVSDVAGY